MPRKITEKEKKEIILDFKKGDSIDELSKRFKFSKITISRHIKKHIDDEEYRDLIRKNNKKIGKNEPYLKRKNFSKEQSVDLNEEKLITQDLSLDESFVEIAPLNYELDNMSQKDLSSIPISDVDFPKVVFMIVDKNIELEIKYLREYPDWQFLSEEELNRKTIQIFDELKVAKSFCKKEQKVIKVPNTNVFKISAASLLKKGISRIVSSDSLISL